MGHSRDEGKGYVRRCGDADRGNSQTSGEIRGRHDLDLSFYANAFAASLRHSCWLYVGTTSLNLRMGASHWLIGPRMRLFATQDAWCTHANTVRPSHTTAYHSNNNVRSLLRPPPSVITTACYGKFSAPTTTGPSRTLNTFASSHELGIVSGSYYRLPTPSLTFQYCCPPTETVSIAPLNRLAALRAQRSSLEDPTKEDGDGDQGRIAASSGYTVRLSVRVPTPSLVH
jgi:hypothetical protein